jgi:P2-related tail formation protein
MYPLSFPADYWYETVRSSRIRVVKSAAVQLHQKIGPAQASRAAFEKAQGKM